MQFGKQRLALFLMVFLGPAFLAQAGYGEPATAPGEIIVWFKTSPTPEEKTQAGELLGMAGSSLRSMQKGLVAQQGLSSTGRIEALQVERLQAPAGVDRDQAIRALASSPLVSYSGPNYLAQYLSGPNDPLYQQGYQWWVTAIGADRVVSEDLLPEGAAITIAILDSGVYLAHEDLSSRLVAGTDFVASGGNGNVPGPNRSIHGTHVAGIAAAATNNRIGIAGAASAANIRIMPVRVGDNDGASYYNVAQGIVWAVDHGARVLNLSLGGTGSDPTLSAAIQYAYEHACVVVAAAGNSALDGNPVIYPAAYPHVIAVASCDISGSHADYSEYQDYVTLAAPGGTYVSDTSTAVLSTIPPKYFASAPATIYNYYVNYGTSMAAPMVAGAAAMLLAQNPSLALESVRYLLVSSADRTGSLAQSRKLRDNYLGYGRVNLYRALIQGQGMLPTPTPVPAVVPAKAYNYPNPFNPFRGDVTHVTIPFTSGEAASPVEVKIYTITGRLVWHKELPANEAAPGKTVDWDGRNDHGELVANGVYPLVMTKNGKNYLHKIAVNNR